MAATLVTSPPAALSAVAADDRQQLRLEKLGVIAGFLCGLLLTLFLEGEILGASPQWVSALAAALTLAVTTRLGLSLGTALARRLAR